PKEGLLVYDAMKGTAKRLDRQVSLSLPHYGDYHIQMSPITSDWSFVGRTDKVLSAASGEVILADSSTLKIKLHEKGPFAIWSKGGVPKADGIVFEHKGNGLFQGNIPVEEKSVTLTLTR
ncbi:MAG: hypothetical protein HQL32_06040, partial [Planctomycetes bacterium]|nr:hypothetical protein [Planctomycetota bacterium]